MVVTVACVKAGTKYGPEYVNTLFDMVRRNLQKGFPGRFVCFTDDPTGLDEGIQTMELKDGLHGWWNKLYLFSFFAFEVGERVLYFDLDTVICGPLDAIAAYQGPFCILRDVYRPDGMQSSVMAWEAGRYAIWNCWHMAGCPMDSRGDQGFIEDYLQGKGRYRGEIQHRYFQDEFPGRFRSFKKECRNDIPRGTSVVFFHGEPRPHEVKDGWVPHVWKIGGGSGLEFITQANVSDKQLAENVKWAKTHAAVWLKQQPAHNGVAIICGGGPSLRNDLWRIKGHQLAGGKIFACNNVGEFLLVQDVIPDNQVFLDARSDNIKFMMSSIEGLPVPKYVASQCHPVMIRSAGSEGVCYHAMQTSYAALTADSALLIGGGSTVGLKAISIAYALGYRTFKLFGFDSSYEDGNHHAYAQSLNDGERTIEVSAGERKFICAPWMITQAEEFKELAPVLVGLGCAIHVYGDGLIPEISKSLEVPLCAADIRAAEILKRLRHIESPIGAEIGVFAGALSARLLARPDLRLTMVDSWDGHPSVEYLDSDDFHAHLTQEQQDKLFEDACKAVEFAGDRAEILRTTSLGASVCFRDEIFDFVFLDADHSYSSIKTDIEAWFRTVKPGGYLCGHDYDNPEFPMWGVKKAVDERFPDRELGENYTWFVKKVK